jgi:pimeloyl-ACP methyl ester carboxylesterase
MSDQVNSHHELPLYFPAGDETLFGIVTRAVTTTGDGAILLTGGGATAPSTNRNRVSVHLARRLAVRGLSTLRFDYHGIGESAGMLAGAPKVDEPYLIDLAGAASCIREHGVERITLIGSCFGARTALAGAPDVSDIAGVALVSPPLRDVPLKEETGTRFGLSMGFGEALRRSLHPRAIRGWLEPGRRRTYLRFLATKISRARQRITGASRLADAWVSEGFLDPIRRLAAQDVPILFIYGTSDWHYEDFQLAMSGRLGEILADAPHVQVTVLEGEVHGLSSVAIQQRVMDLVLGWLDERIVRDVVETGAPT